MNSATSSTIVRETGQQAGKSAESLSRGTEFLMQTMKENHWCFELEADVTIPSEYIFLQRVLKRKNPSLEQKIATYLRRKQNVNGSWALYEDGPGDMSATVKAYFALKLIGHSVDDIHMVSARKWVLQNGGAEKVNVFTRITLALFDQLPWVTVPAMPVEMMFLPKWWFFHLSKVSYWSRCVIVPLLIIFAERPVYKVAGEQSISELFVQSPRGLTTLDKIDFHQPVRAGFLLLDRCLKLLNRAIPRFIREPALARAEKWTREHCVGVGGIGGIFPAMVNAVIGMKIRGAKEDDSDLVRTINAIDELLIVSDEEAYCQPCESPVWDTCLALNAVTETDLSLEDPRVMGAVEWLFRHQVFEKGDWSEKASNLLGGGWAFQYENNKYPDIDDTSMVLMALLRVGAHENPLMRERVDNAVDWILGMQNPDGGWAAFDIDNNAEYLNKIPFADHGALVDPSTADLTARCIEMLAMLGHDRNFPPIKNGLEFLKLSQEADGSWYGRWGVNYVYGTWSVLAAIGAIGEEREKAYVQKALRWLEDAQNEDGGWGESCNSYDDTSMAGVGVSTPSQTAWALLGLMAASVADSSYVKRGIEYLVRNQKLDGGWDEEMYTGTGFPRVFYLRYHGYRHYFPLWALANYQRLLSGMPTRQADVISSFL